MPATQHDTRGAADLAPEFSAHLLKLRRLHPFFATLSLFVRFGFDESVAHVSTDGRQLRVNPDLFRRLSPPQRTALLLHVTLHAALLHGVRCGARQHAVWNIAADIVVNNLMLEDGHFEPPAGTAVDTSFADQSAERVYELLMTLPMRHPELAAFAPPRAGEEGSGAALSRERIADIVAQRYDAIPDLPAPATDGRDAPGHGDGEAHDLRQHWQGVHRRAEAAARLAGRHAGSLPLGLRREIGQVTEPALDWRTLLWRHLVLTPCDYTGFDRRFVHAGLYLEVLESQSLHAAVVLDTSGSVSNDELARFVSELHGIAGAYPHLVVDVYAVDARVHGPFPLRTLVEADVAVLRGGGGTSFAAIFSHLADERELPLPPLVVVLTDGWGRFPSTTPDTQVLWVVCEGGRSSEEFPFGDAVRLAGDED